MVARHDKESIYLINMQNSHLQWIFLPVKILLGHFHPTIQTSVEFRYKLYFHIYIFTYLHLTYKCHTWVKPSDGSIRSFGKGQKKKEKKKRVHPKIQIFM